MVFIATMDNCFVIDLKPTLVTGEGEFAIIFKLFTVMPNEILTVLLSRTSSIPLQSHDHKMDMYLLNTDCSGVTLMERMYLTQHS